MKKTLTALALILLLAAVAFSQTTIPGGCGIGTIPPPMGSAYFTTTLSTTA